MSKNKSKNRYEKTYNILIERFVKQATELMYNGSSKRTKELQKELEMTLVGLLFFKSLNNALNKLQSLKNKRGTSNGQKRNTK